jgi:hypothetical protein
VKPTFQEPLRPHRASIVRVIGINTRFNQGNEMMSQKKRATRETGELRFSNPRFETVMT